MFPWNDVKYGRKLSANLKIQNINRNRTQKDIVRVTYVEYKEHLYFYRDCRRDAHQRSLPKQNIQDLVLLQHR